MKCKSYLPCLVTIVILQGICDVDSVRQFSLKLSQSDEEFSVYELAEKYLKDAREQPNVQKDDCVRPCHAGDPKRICYYEFTVEVYQTMGRACGNCSKGVVKDCSGSQCATGDGILRTIYSINRQLPGTKIEVCKGDMVAVRVMNHADGLGLTIHWHGMMMRNTPHMDGVPMVTQYPIPSGDHFLYTFWAPDPGTYFYHAHSGQHQPNGISGPLIVKVDPSLDPNRQFYDTDKHIMFLSDWNRLLTLEFRPGLSRAWPDSLLVNGRGKPTDPETNELTKIPYKVFHVKGDERNRIRVMGATTADCPLRIQVEEHKMHIVASDGMDLKPFTVDTLMVHTGERYDIVIKCNEPKRNYWIHIRGEGLCHYTNLNQIYQLAVLSCDGDPNDETITPETSNPGFTGYEEGIYMNNPNSTCRPDSNRKCVHQLEAHSVDVQLRDTQPAVQLVIKLKHEVLEDIETFDPNSDNWKPFVTFVSYDYGAIMTMNGIQNVAASAPLLNHIDELEQFGVCHDGNWPDKCKGKVHCSCPHVQPVPLNSIVQIIFLGADDVVEPVNHPMHLHGHSFQVLEVGQFFENENVSAHNLLKKKYDNKSPPFKDTLSIASRGYAVIKFEADNPGLWLMHCHIENHMRAGMMMTFKVGTADDLAAGPSSNQNCQCSLMSKTLSALKEFTNIF